MRKFEKISYPEFVKVFGDNKTLYDDYMLPKRGTKYSAGYDFYAIKDYVIKPGEIVKIPTGYKSTFNSDEMLMIVVRSSMGFKYNVRLTNQVGIIESDYYNNPDNEGHMWVCLQNHGDKEYIINKGDAYAQGIFVKFLTTDDDKADAVRTGGIGSTNKKKKEIKMNKKYYITTPIYYPSANFHIGHCYTTIIADAIARYKRLNGYDVFFQTGTDEHGQKIEQKAKEAGVTPKEYVDKIIENAKDLWNSLDISYDYFIRTTDESHAKAVQDIFKKLYDQGDIYKGSYEGLYCVPCESFWTETQLVDGKCPDCGREVKLVTEEAYFFKLSKYQDRLIELYENNPDFILPVSRKNELVNNFIKPGLEDLCVSRTSVKWGIPVAFDPKHIVYVWIDALTNYITSLGYPNEKAELFKKYWPADLHLVGKEITRFHAIIWPALLWALDLPLPKQVFGHGWLIINGGKISKSLGNYKDPREYIKDYGVDAVRYFALREVPFGNDGAFSEEALINRTNSDLVNNLGNLVNRTISMAHKYFDGIVVKKNLNDELDNDLIKSVTELHFKVDKAMNSLHVDDALNEIFDTLRKCNKYIDEATPWVLAKDETKRDKLATVIYNLLESIRICTVLLSPFIPTTAEKIFKQLNCDGRSIESIKEFGYLTDGSKLNEPIHLFDRIEINK